jgi:hypothetical protein
MSHTNNFESGKKFDLAIVMETLVPLLLQVAIIISPKSSIVSSRFFGLEKSLASLRERSHILIQPAAVATVRNDPQSPMPIGRPSISLVGSICFIVPWNVRT